MAQRPHGSLDPKIHQKIDPTCKSVYDRLLMESGANLASKIDPRAAENPSKIVSFFELRFRLIFTIFWIDFEAKLARNPSKNHPKIDPKSSENGVRSSQVGPSWPNLSSRWPKIASEMQVSMYEATRCDCPVLLERNLAQHGANINPKASQNGGRGGGRQNSGAGAGGRTQVFHS